MVLVMRHTLVPGCPDRRKLHRSDGKSVSLSVLQVKVLFVRNLANSVTEEILEKSFSAFGKLERVKKLKDYAFIHFEEREGAVKVHTFIQNQSILSKKQHKRMDLKLTKPSFRPWMK